MIFKGIPKALAGNVVKTVTPQEGGSTEFIGALAKLIEQNPEIIDRLKKPVEKSSPTFSNYEEMTEAEQRAAEQRAAEQRAAEQNQPESENIDREPVFLANPFQRPMEGPPTQIPFQRPMEGLPYYSPLAIPMDMSSLFFQRSPANNLVLTPAEVLARARNVFIRSS
jgi:hypothetical protein